MSGERRQGGSRRPLSWRPSFGAPGPARSTLALLAAASALSGCVAFSPDAGLGVTGAIVNADLGKDIVAIRDEAGASGAAARVHRLLRAPLTADSAVQIALLSNRGLQASFNELGISEAQYVASSLPPNPTISFSRIAGGADLEIERKLVANLLDLLTLQARTEIAEGRFRQAQMKAALDVLRLAAETRRGFFRATAAGQLVSALQQAGATATAANDLVRRLGETGSVGKLEQAREQVFLAELTAQLGQARLRQRVERERLTRSLGLFGPDIAFKLPAVLPALPARPRSVETSEVEAVTRRVDLRVARMEVDTVARSYGLAEATRYVSVLNLAGISRYSRANAEPQIGRTGKDKVNFTGFDLEVQIPLFDFGGAKAREAEQVYQQAVNRLAEKAIAVRSEAREAYQTYRATYDIARHYRSEILPLRKIISDESQLRYNGMLADVSTLIIDARQQILSSVAAVEAQREFWIADADLKAAIVGGGGTSSDNTAPLAIAAGDVPAN